MRDYGRVFSTFWTSEDTRALSDDGKILALYLLTGPHGTIAGVFRLPDGYVIEDVRWEVPRVRQGFAELFRNRFANRCETTHWVWINKFLTWNRPENPNQWTAARKIADQVPAHCAWKAEFTRVFARAAGDPPPLKKNRSGTLSKRSPSGSGAVTVSGTAPGAEGDARGAARATRSPATHLPGDFELTPERRALAVTEHLDPERTFAKFKNYWNAAAGAKARKRDWDAAWANWCLTEHDRSAGNGSGKPPRRAKSVAELEAEELANAQH
jgi:hypothetical protein